MSTPFAVTWDYRCPFARNIHEHVLVGLAAGAPWDVGFVAFSLEQVHLTDDDTPVWEEPERYPGLLPMLAGLVVRERQPEKFRDTHAALFSIRHDHALDLRDRDVVARFLDGVGVDGAGVLSEVDAGWPLDVLRDDHIHAVDKSSVFGVPTFISGDEAVFVRVMHRPEGDSAVAISTIDRLLDLTDGWLDLNEFKRTKVLR